MQLHLMNYLTSTNRVISSPLRNEYGEFVSVKNHFNHVNLQLMEKEYLTQTLPPTIGQPYELTN